jgi:hypothetical protein
MINWKAFGRRRPQPDRDTTLERLRKVTQNIMTTGFLTDNRTQHFTNTSLDDYLHMNAFRHLFNVRKELKTRRF